MRVASAPAIDHGRSGRLWKRGAAIVVGGLVVAVTIAAAQPSARSFVQACLSADLHPTLIGEGDMTGVVIVAKLWAERPCLLAGTVSLTIQRRGRMAAIKGNPLLRSRQVVIRKTPRPVLHGRWDNWCRGGSRGMTLRFAYPTALRSASLRVVPACIDDRGASRLFALPLYPDYP
jgi:hypothetical protein